MNDAEKSTAEKKKAGWRVLLEALVPGIFIWVAIVEISEGYTRGGQHSGAAIVPLVISGVLTWATFIFVFARLRSASSR
jgi:hypothetical protein